MWAKVGSLLQHEKFAWLDDICRKQWVPVAALGLFPVLILSHSLWQGAYNLDPHHWGLMLSNAKDLAVGKIPYQEIFIQYGLLTTIVHGAAYSLLGGNLQALIGVTAFFYVVGLVGLYFLSLRAVASKKLALFAYISACLLHPVAIYPWSNYIAFPFLVFGAWFFLAPGRQVCNAFLAGVLFALAALCREGLMPAVFLFLLIASVAKPLLLKKSWRELVFEVFAVWGGLLLPLALFFLFLWRGGLIGYWYTTSVELPRLYVSALMPYGILGAVAKLAQFFVLEFLRFNPRVIFFALILGASVVVTRLFFIATGFLRSSANLVLMGAFSILLLSAALHGNEIFRLATSVAVGAGLVYWVASLRRFENLLFVASSFLLLVSLGRGGDGNYFLPSRTQMGNSVVVETPVEFRGQKWALEVQEFYQSLDRDMRTLKMEECGVRFFQNTTHDAFISALSPFSSYQVAPFGNGPGWERLRPEFDVQKRVAEDKDIALFLKVSLVSASDYLPPPGYAVARRYVMPKVVFFEQGDTLLIVVPEICSGFLGQ